MDQDAVQEIVKSLTKPEHVRFDDEHQVVVTPIGFQVHNLASMLPPPKRVQQRVTLLTPADLCAYVKAWGRTETTVVFADEPQAAFEAVLDYHTEANERGTCEHTAHYTCPKSNQWELWMVASGKAMTQAVFAKFIEENLPDIKTPPAADLLQVALQLDVHKSAKFSSELRLDNGERQFEYIEEIRGTQRKGSLQIPEVFRIAIPVFHDGKLYEIDARLRYRMNDGNLSLWYELVRAIDTYRLAISEVTAAIGKDLTDAYTLLRGKRG